MLYDGLVFCHHLLPDADLRSGMVSARYTAVLFAVDRWPGMHGHFPRFTLSVLCHQRALAETGRQVPGDHDRNQAHSARVDGRCRRDRRLANGMTVQNFTNAVTVVLPRAALC